MICSESVFFRAKTFRAKDEKVGKNNVQYFNSLNQNIDFASLCKTTDTKNVSVVDVIKLFLGEIWKF